LIIHGASDPFVSVAHGWKTTASIPHASTFWVAGLGHDIPPESSAAITRRILEHADRAH
jgi:pimeloyl-ACP methyl ester carboxylesterase